LFLDQGGFFSICLYSHPVFLLKFCMCYNTSPCLCTVCHAFGGVCNDALCRLPIVQGSAICFLVPAIALFAQDQCHPVPAAAASHVSGGMYTSTFHKVV